LGHCKKCHRAGVKANRAANLDHYLAFDRARGNQPDRVAAREAYAKTDRGRAALRRGGAGYINRHPARRKANNIVTAAIRDGKLMRLPCWVCGCEAVEGHHPDYSRPLEVIWLCKAHHQELHNEHNEYQRQAGSV
jgi:hypothetical protein